MTVQKNVAVVIGTGGMGIAAVRRIGAGRTVVLADFNQGALDGVAETLRGDGYDVVAHLVDVSQKESVDTLATDAAALGPIVAVVHTAGLSPTQAPTAAILAVDLLGTAHVLDAFGDVIAPGGSGVFISSMSAYMMPVSAELEQAFALTPTDDLLNIPGARAEDFANPGHAYGVSKRANQFRVRRAATQWGARGARVNSISPGVISTPMGQQELAGESGAHMRGMIAMSGTGRIGTPDDIAAAVAFLTGPDASFITGTDILVDGGVIGEMTTRSE